ncbi:hypothetical protein [Komagataeibacter europaeus]|uniref:hypothetical protein n=1 Tax=Komagataeibacter europaeus TaxID=33995 RepID=UPI0012F927B2|nr:hypothetical protein [Komagataeibacter europaeus]
MMVGENGPQRTAHFGLTPFLRGGSGDEEAVFRACQVRRAADRHIHRAILVGAQPSQRHAEGIGHGGEIRPEAWQGQAGHMTRPLARTAEAAHAPDQQAFAARKIIHENCRVGHHLLGLWQSPLPVMSVRP